MKESTKILIETGLVPGSIAKLVGIWSPGVWSSEDAEVERRELTRQEIAGLVNRLIELIERDSEIPELKETDLDLQALIKNSWLTVSLETPWATGLATLTAKAAITRTGKLVLYVGGTSAAVADMLVKRGNELLLSSGKLITLKDVEPRYIGDRVEFYICNFEEKF